jgi:hypothetical protein
MDCQVGPLPHPAASPPHPCCLLPLHVLVLKPPQLPRAFGRPKFPSSQTSSPWKTP